MKSRWYRVKLQKSVGGELFHTEVTVAAYTAEDASFQANLSQWMLYGNLWGVVEVAPYGKPEAKQS